MKVLNQAVKIDPNKTRFQDPTRDSLIAATAAARGWMVATRHTADFARLENSQLRDRFGGLGGTVGDLVFVINVEGLEDFRLREGGEVATGGW